MTDGQLERLAIDAWQKVPWDHCRWQELDATTRAIIRLAVAHGHQAGFAAGRTSVPGDLPPEGVDDE